MSLEGQNFSASAALENEQRFVLDTTGGLQKFHDFLVSEAGQIDALDPELVIADLALPESLASSLNDLRFEYKDLVLLTKECLQTDTEALPESAMAAIASQYRAYVAADERFSTAYVAHQAAQANSSQNGDAPAAAENHQLESPDHPDHVVQKTAQERPAVLEEPAVGNQPEERVTSAELSEIYGLILPPAGPAGVIAARSFRSGLEQIKNTHLDLKKNPTKLALVQAIIRAVFVIPASGLTEEQVSKITTLVQELNDSPEVSQNAAQEAVVVNDSAQEHVSHPLRADHVLPLDAAAADTTASKDWNVREYTKRNGPMVIGVDARDGGSIKVTLAKNAVSQTKEPAVETDESTAKVIDQLIQTLGGHAGKEIKQTVGINNSIPQAAARASLKREEVSSDSLTALFLTSQPRYRAFFAENDIAPASFEKQLQATIKSIDAQEIDYWESKFDEPYRSAFSFLQDLTPQKIQDLNELSTKQRKELLRAENVKYESYVAWMNIYERFDQSSVPQTNASFAELFTLWMMETEMLDIEMET